MTLKVEVNFFWSWSSLKFCPSILSSHLECGVPVEPGIWIQNTLHAVRLSLQIAEEDEDKYAKVACCAFLSQIKLVFIKN